MFNKNIKIKNKNKKLLPKQMFVHISKLLILNIFFVIIFCSQKNIFAESALTESSSSLSSLDSTLSVSTQNIIKRTDKPSILRSIDDSILNRSKLATERRKKEQEEKIEEQRRVLIEKLKTENFSIEPVVHTPKNTNSLLAQSSNLESSTTETKIVSFETGLDPSLKTLLASAGKIDAEPKKVVEEKIADAPKVSPKDSISEVKEKIQKSKNKKKVYRRYVYKPKKTKSKLIFVKPENTAEKTYLFSWNNLDKDIFYYKTSLFFKKLFRGIFWGCVIILAFTAFFFRKKLQLFFAPQTPIFNSFPIKNNKIIFKSFPIR